MLKRSLKMQGCYWLEGECGYIRSLGLNGRPKVVIPAMLEPPRQGTFFFMLVHILA